MAERQSEGKRINDEKAIEDDAYKNPLCAFKYTGLDNEGEKINPFVFIERGENADCNSAVKHFLKTVSMDKITKLINEIPETAGNLSVMPAIQKAFYLKLMQKRLDFLKAINL